MTSNPRSGLTSASAKSAETTAEVEILAEYRQARSRLWNVSIAICYLYFSGIFTWQLSGSPSALAIYVAGFAIFVTLVYLDTRLRPGVFPVRRLIAMTGDFTSLAYAMLVGEAPALPLFVFIVWVTLGNGMRFGQRYLVIASVMAQLSLLTLFVLSAYWQAQPYLLVTFSMVALVLPAYAHVLLGQTAQARDAALVAMQAKSRFLAHASHDLRQPIHSVGYYLSLLRSARTKDDRERLIDRIERALGSVSRLFKSLLDISQLDSGSVAHHPEVVSLHQVLSDLVQQNQQSADWNEVELRYVRTNAWATADSTLLTTMVQNLLSNAIKYARGSRVVVGVRRRGTTAAIEVHDAGIGIDAVHLPRIFEEFYRAHVEGDHDTEGVGLGLAIVNKLAKLSGFSLVIRSRRGRGTTAGIYGIPVCSAQPEAKSPTKRTLAKPMAGYRVILIEDNADVLDATSTLIEQWGCEVQAFPGQPDQVKTADLIIADYDLGNRILGTDAIDAVRLLLGNEVPAILMTGHADALANEKYLNAGIQILAKPVRPAVLRSIVSTLRMAGQARQSE